MNKQKKCIIFDCQGLQTTSFNRGMGRYSAYLLKNVMMLGLSKKYDEVIFLLNQNLEISKSVSFLEKISSKNSKIIKVDFFNECVASNDTLEKYKKDLNAYLKKDIKQSDVTFVILSNFELGQAISVFPDGAKKVMLLYDLIPLLFSAEYLDNLKAESDYFIRFKSIFEADHIFSISQSTKEDCCTYLNLESSKITNISGGPIDNFDEKAIEHEIEKSIAKPYFLYPSGDNWRKNNKRVIDGFNKFNRDYKYQLVVTSHFSGDTINKLKGSSADVIFTGQITNSEISTLYENAVGVIFPSLAEGLGLPVLEAARYNKPILLSSIDVFKEFDINGIIKCDPEDSDDIALGMNKMAELIFNKSKIVTEELLKKYSWDLTADKFLNVISNIKKNEPKKLNKRIALVGPAFDGYSAIGKVCQELMVRLNEYADADYYFEEPNKTTKIRKSFAKYVWNYFPTSKLLANSDSYDQIIYNIGNSEYHLLSYLAAQMIPDTLILHDLDLSGLDDLLSKNFPNWKERSSIDTKLSKLVAKSELSKHIYSLCNKQNRIIVHSNYSKNEVMKLLENKEVNLQAQGLPVVEPKITNRTNDRLMISFSGIINPNKGISSFIDLVKKYHAVYDFSVFGFSNYDPTYLELTKLQEKGLIKLYTNISDYKFDNLLKKTNLLINLRPNYRGETSKTVLDGLRVGVVPVICNKGWFAEIPDNISFKVENITDLNELIENEKKLKDRIYSKTNMISSYLSKNNNFDKYVQSILERS